MKWPSGGAQPEILHQAAAALVEHAVERGAETVRSSGCSTSSHFAAGPSSVPRFRPSRLSVSGLVKTLSAETSQSQIRSPEPVSASARRSTSETMPVGDAAGEGVLHHREADQHHDQHQAAEQRRADDVVGDDAGHRHAGGDHPDHQQEPGRDQQHRAVEAVGGEIDDQREARRPRSAPATSARCRRRPPDRTAPPPPARRERPASRW